MQEDPAFAREALREGRAVGGMESERRLLKRCLEAGVPVTWVPIPAVYRGELSAFRPVRDSVAVMRAAVGW